MTKGRLIYVLLIASLFAYMLASMGLTTGIDMQGLLALRAKVAEWLSAETLHGTLWRAGLPKTFAAA